MITDIHDYVNNPDALSNAEKVLCNYLNCLLCYKHNSVFSYKFDELRAVPETNAISLAVTIESWLTSNSVKTYLDVK